MKKIIDENGRVFGKISMIDFLVIIIVVVIGSALYIRYNVLEPTSGTTQQEDITYTISIFGSRDYTVNSLKVGDTLFDRNSGGYAIGTITDIKVTDALKASEKSDGTIVMGNYFGCYDITITLLANGSISNGKYLVNKTYEINANSVRVFFTKFCTFEATIMEIM